MQGGAIELAAQSDAPARRTAWARSLSPTCSRPHAWLALLAWRSSQRDTESCSTCTKSSCHLSVASGESHDVAYAMEINWLSQFPPDAVIFNSRYHFTASFGGAPGTCKVQRFPDYNHLRLIKRVQARAVVSCRGASRRNKSPRPPTTQGETPHPSISPLSCSGTKQAGNMTSVPTTSVCSTGCGQRAHPSAGRRRGKLPPGDRLI